MVTVTSWLAVPSVETAVKLSVIDLAGAELLDRRLAVVGGVGPVAVGGEREGAVAVAAGGAGLGREAGLALIDVGDGERAAGGQIAGDRRRRRPRSPRRSMTPPITGTSLVPLMVTVTSWLAVPSVETAVKLSVSDLAGAELLDRRLAVVGGVGPAAVGGEREGAVAVAAGGAGLGGEVGLALIDVGDGERAAGRQVAGDRRATSSVTAPVETPPITGTSLVPLMVTVTSWLAVPSVETAVKLSVMRLAGAELLDRRLAVVGGVGPGAVGGEREGAVAVAAGGAGLGREAGLALIDVGDGERAAGGQVAGDRPPTSSVTAPVRDAADHRHVVGAVDGDGDVLRDNAAVLVVECDGVDFVHGLAGGEWLQARCHWP